MTKTRVLVIDDEPQILRALRINLSVRGYEVTTASTGAGALHAAAEHKPDVVILDPPRAGCPLSLLEAVAQVSPTRIVYVSCDPATLARDIKILSGLGYEFVEATPVDMFPWTLHVETVALLSKR